MVSGSFACPPSGHVLLLMVAAAAVSSTCIDAVRMRLLWLSIICFVLFMQL